MPRPALLLALVLAGALAGGCASTPPPEPRHFDYFAEPLPASREDPWFEKVGAWQERARKAAAARPAESELAGKIGDFEREERLALAQRIATWSQRRAREHYVTEPDEIDPSKDHWPTYRELIAKNGDDCDGLDLIAYEMLLDFGFPPEEVYRAVIRRDRDRKNHMITLWFESPDDPWVIDVTGAMTLEVRRLSALPGWTPTKVFDEERQFRVRERRRVEILAGD